MYGFFVVLGYFVYQTIKAVVIGADLYFWHIAQLSESDWDHIKSVGSYKLDLFKFFLECVTNSFWYNPKKFVLESNKGKTWSGFGTGR